MPDRKARAKSRGVLNAVQRNLDVTLNKSNTEGFSSAYMGATLL